MSASAHLRTVEILIAQEEWEEARKVIQAELAREPDNHWLMTQLGVTHYEQEDYREALKLFLSSLKIVGDCPLTLWNVAGALDAIGKLEVAIEIYTWLLKSKKSAEVDPCWESAEWTDALKTDCVYRLGVCFQHLEQGESAAHCFRQYVNLLLAGMNGSYPIEDAASHIRKLQSKGKQQVGKEVRETIHSTLQDSGIQSIQGGRRKLPKLKLDELLAR